MKEYYIYSHSLEGVVFYVGSNWMRANPNRAYNVGKKDRTKSYNEYVESHGIKEDIVIKILERFDNKKDCLKREFEIIEEYQKNNLAMVCKEGNAGSKNGMYGKRGKDCSNTGKIRTEEHKNHYREAFKDRQFKLICKKCNKEFISKGANSKYCDECKRN